jgi:hypothetical protein
MGRKRTLALDEIAVLQAVFCDPSLRMSGSTPAKLTKLTDHPPVCVRAGSLHLLRFAPVLARAPARAALPTLPTSRCVNAVIASGAARAAIQLRRWIASLRWQ